MPLSATLLVALVATQVPHLDAIGPRGSDATTVAAVNTVVQSVNQAWSDRFREIGRTYTPPRVLILRIPAGHPAHGAGYTPSLGVVIDLSDIEAVDHVFGADAASLNALLIAHEMGHHVQFLMRNDQPSAAPRGVSREHQADCYAGWWLAAANDRTGSNSDKGRRPMPNLDRDFPRMLYLLSSIQAGRFAARSDEHSHGSSAARVLAIETGLAARSPVACDQSKLEVRAP